MLFVLCIAFLNLAIGYAAGLYWGPIPWSLDRRRTYVSPDAEVDGWADGAGSFTALPAEPASATRPAEEEAVTEVVESLPSAEIPPATPPDAPLVEALRCLASNLGSYRDELAQLEATLLTELAGHGECQVDELQGSLRIQNIQLRVWSGELAAALDSDEVTADAREVASEIRLSLDAFIALAQTINDKLEAFAGDGPSTGQQATRDGIGKLLENSFPLRDRLEEALWRISRDAESTPALWDEGLQITNRAGWEAKWASWSPDAEGGAEEPFCAALFDVDRCREINQARGVEFASQVLRRMAQTLTENSRSEDFIARYSGQQFMLLMPGLSIEQAASHVDGLRRQIESASADESAQAATVTCGVVHGTEDRETLEGRLHRLVGAGKSAGRNRTFCWQDGKPIEFVAATDDATPDLAS